MGSYGFLCLPMGSYVVPMGFLLGSYGFLLGAYWVPIGVRRLVVTQRDFPVELFGVFAGVIYLNFVIYLSIYLSIHPSIHLSIYGLRVRRRLAGAVPPSAAHDCEGVAVYVVYASHMMITHACPWCTRRVARGTRGTRACVGS